MHAMQGIHHPPHQVRTHPDYSFFDNITAKTIPILSIHLPCLILPHIACTPKAQNQCRNSRSLAIPGIYHPLSHCQPAGMQPTDSANHRLQESYDPWSNDQDRSLPIVLTFFLLLFLLVGFFSLYLFRYVMDYLNTLHQTPAAAAALRGLPTSVISSFPTFPYSSLKGVQHGNDRLECTVCLAEFSDDDMLRMLTGCSHVFHQECIDLWFETHTTCPICRRDLDDGKGKKVEVVIPMPESNSSGEGEVEGAAERQECRISFKEDGSREGEGEGSTERQECRNSFKEDDGGVEGVNNGPDGRR